ncbi:OLC1v1023556C1 [Oldenlandia corymbosa var. corymbosa]|uniref:OLC1v1023556C1 n=1 Tax=Oldenlandia corymbosa var. corymbosa TaxID=529605 RepID=A0AAV1C0K9_OLDCO|nr:OLC1v1023556C1 [Oldenlandia corymbosa var. corymbosa]
MEEIPSTLPRKLVGKISHQNINPDHMASTHSSGQQPLAVIRRTRRQERRGRSRRSKKSNAKNIATQMTDTTDHSCCNSNNNNNTSTNCSSINEEEEDEENGGEEVEDKIMALQKIVPGGESLGVDKLFEETAGYILELQYQVKALKFLATFVQGSEKEKRKLGG